jgi:hypothetical protein
MWLEDVGTWFAAIWSWVTGLDSGEWQAIGTLGTMAIAVVAAVVALRQVGEARRLRVEQAKPYVALYLELGKEVDASLMFLVIRNFGQTTARDIEIFGPERMLRAWGNADDPEELKIVERLPVLVPGQEWRTLFDWGPDRHKANLVDPYSFTVKSKDSGGRKLKDETFVIDWTTFVTSRMIGVKTVHDVGKALEKIEHHLNRWNGGGNGMKVVTRNGDAIDRWNQEEHERRMAQWESQPRETWEEHHGAVDHQAVQTPTGAAVELSDYREGQDSGVGDDDYTQAIDHPPAGDVETSQAATEDSSSRPEASPPSRGPFIDSPDVQSGEASEQGVGYEAGTPHPWSPDKDNGTAQGRKVGAPSGECAHG